MNWILWLVWVEILNRVEEGRNVLIPEGHGSMVGYGWGLRASRRDLKEHEHLCVCVCVCVHVRALLGKESRVRDILGALCPTYLKCSSVITECAQMHKNFGFYSQHGPPN